MALPTRAVTCKLYDQQGNPAAKARIRFTLTVPELIDGVVAPEMLEKTADENGVAVFDLVPNVLGVNGSQYAVRAWNPDTGKKFVDGVCTVPDAACYLHDILVSDPPPTLDSAQQALAAAQAYAVAAGNSADDAEDSADHAQATVPVWAAVAPLNPIPGAQWVSSITGRRFTWVVDANSSQWVEMGTVVAIGYASQEAAAVAVAAAEAAEASEDAALAQAAAALVSRNAAAASAAAAAVSAGVYDEVMVDFIEVTEDVEQAQTGFLGFITNLASSVSAVTGAGMVYYDEARNYVSGTMGKALKDVKAAAAQKIELAASAGASLVGFIAAGSGAVARKMQDKSRERVSLGDSLTEAQIADTQLASPLMDLTAAIQASIDNNKRRLFKVVNATSIRYGTRKVQVDPGIYVTAGAVLVDGDLAWRSRGGHSSAIHHYTGTGVAVTVNSSDPAIGAPQNTRVFAMEGIALLAPNAAKGIYFGGASQRHLEILRSQIVGVPGRALDMGEGVYFLRFGNSEIRDCGEGIYVGHYCDLFTADDRCLFGGNAGPDLILAAPTFRIDNNDFEGAAGASAHIRIVQSTAVPASVRAGLILGNRFGPEGANPARYDIEFVDDGAVTSAEVSTDTRVWNNVHFSKSGATAKIAPVNIASKTRRLDFRGYRWAAEYTSGYYVTSTDAAKAFATGTVCDSQIDDVMDAHPSIRGLFATGGNGKYERAWAASSTIVNLSVLRRVGVYSGADRGKYEAFTVTPIVASGTGSLHEDAVGIAVYDQAVATRPIWYAVNGTIIPSTLDTTGSTFGAPVYLQASGALGLAPTAFPLVVARVNTVGANAKLLVSIENKRVAAVIVNSDITARGFDELALVYNSAITADRTVTLNSTTQAFGDVLRVTRTTLATGAFNVIVGSKTLTPGTFAEFTYFSSGWVCTSAGTA